ncbi:MAG: two component, sigma54 specific, transcriptional regulator, Fis family [Gammaproteobacteria bacterium]|nr:two component, sigma54 specific, transcriptional regulator, Fis family [Gammaproteobacteria bacterium]
MKHDLYIPVTSMKVPVLEKQILIVEDENVFAKAVQKQLMRSGYKSQIASDLKTADEMFQTLSPDLILLDTRLPDGSGLDFLSNIRNKHNSNIAVLVMSAYGELEDAVSAMKLGASDYLKKPVDLDELLINVEKVLDKSELTRKLTYSTKREQHAAEGVDFLGECQAIVAIREQVKQIGRLTQASDSIPPTVLILGETGTGKDVVAKMLHINSSRKDKPFVHVDCASLPKDLIEAELFGHEKGAFTNAHVARTGLIEAAEDGVLFLDEIGELPPGLQSKLLAVLERRILRRVGTTQERPIAAWFIAATNRNIDELIDKGEFRSDLYYRLNVLNIGIPPLRERNNDIMILAQYFAEHTARRYGLKKVTFSKGAEQAIKGNSWPGNVRELKHLIERAVLLTGGGELDVESLSLSTHSAAPVSEVSGQLDDMTLSSAELMLIRQALDRMNGNVSRAARELGITRMALRYRMKKYDLQ